MVSVRAAKSKGNQFEYDCQASLQQIWPSTTRTAERGFQRQYDLHIEEDDQKRAIECKRHASFSWNQLQGLYEKLLQKSNMEPWECFLLFKPNRQPCLVFCKIGEMYTIRTFEDVFKVPFIKHKSTRAKK